jgi:hypothetical protein
MQLTEYGLASLSDVFRLDQVHGIRFGLPRR